MHILNFFRIKSGWIFISYKGLSFQSIFYKKGAFVQKMRSLAGLRWCVSLCEAGVLNEDTRLVFPRDEIEPSQLNTPMFLQVVPSGLGSWACAWFLTWVLLVLLSWNALQFLSLVDCLASPIVTICHQDAA